MRKTGLTLFLVLFLAALAPAQTTTFNGVIKDLSNAPIPTGQVAFALKPSVDTTISGQGRFVPTTTFCEIHNPSVTSTSGTGTITVNVNTAQTWQVGDSLIFFGTGDSTLNASSVATPYTITLVNSTTSFNFTQSGTHTNGAVGTVGGLYKSGGTGACSVMQSSAITPANTYYSVSLWPIFSLTSSFNTYAIGSGPVDISTVVPTPGQQPAYSFVDLFTNQTITGIKTFSNGIVFNGGITSAGPNTLNGGGTLAGAFTLNGQLTVTAPKQLASTYYASQFAGADCGARINNFEATVTTPAEIIADNTCPVGTWTTVTISNSFHTLRCLGPVQFTVNQIIMAGNFDKLDSCYLIQIGGIDQFTVNVTGNDNRVLNNTIDGSASQPSKNGSDNTIEIKGSRNWVENNKVIATQGNGIAVEATATGGDHNTVTKNKVYNATAAAFGVGIVVGNVSPANGSFANWNAVLDNYVDTTSSDCIFITASEGSITLSGGTMNQFNIVNGNQTRNCGDSSIEIGEGSYETQVSYNIIDAKLNGGLICRDCINPHFIGNTITMESTTAADGIDISSQNLPATFDQHAQVEGNIVRGWIPAGRACFYSNGSGAHFKANDCEFTAGAANIHSITGTSGTVTLITNQPLLLPNAQSIIVAGTTNFNGTYTLLSVNDLTNTYTFAKAGTIAQETAGTISFTTANGSNLQGNGIACGVNGNCSAQGNRIRNVLVGINFDLDGSPHSETGLFAEGNWIVRTGTAITIANITCTGCAFNNNHLMTYATVGFNDSGASGTGTSYVWGNSFSAAGFGTTPNESNAGFPNFSAMNPYQDSAFTSVLRLDHGGLMCFEGLNPVTVGPGWDLLGCNSTSHMFQVGYGSNGFVPIGTTGNTSGTHSDSGLYQTAQAAGCTTAASIGGTCVTPTTITWPIPFADANYKVTCQGAGAITNFPIMGTVTISSASAITVQTMALTAAAASFTTISCEAVHN